MNSVQEFVDSQLAQGRGFFTKSTALDRLGLSPKALANPQSVRTYRQSERKEREISMRDQRARRRERQERLDKHKGR